jgi:choline dehydrogenase
MAAGSAKTFDYVIVGAGSAGCVLANRLSADPKTSVLLLEAGGKARETWIDMPIAFTKYDRLPRLNWNFVSEPEPHAGGRRIDAPRGKVLGGSSTINGMVYARGHRLDYDDWAQKGLKGWGYKDVLPYFKRSERHWLGESKYHGGSGELEVIIPDSDQMFTELEAATVAAGWPKTDDYHGEQTEGAQRCEVTITRKGRRGHTARTFLDPALKRPNLTVESHALTTRILFEGKRATGVEYEQDGELKSVRAGKEVILSGGALSSPQILMLSGIGPGEHLRSLGIDVVSDLPGVGTNLVEHPFLFVGWKVDPKKVRSELRLDRAVVSVLRWFFFGRGPFANNGAAGNVFIRTTPEADRPDMQLTCMSPGVTGRQIWMPGAKTPNFMLGVGVSMIRQDSRGEITLKSADPHDPPKILFNLFKEQSDVDRMIRGIRAARKIYHSPPLGDLIGEEVSPGEAMQSDQDLAAFVRATGAITLHPVGTCKMGVDGDPMAVLDDQMRVRGVENLRVIDASVMPNVPGGNTNAPTVMIAEKGADLILGRSLPSADV